MEISPAPKERAPKIYPDRLAIEACGKATGVRQLIFAALIDNYTTGCHKSDGPDILGWFLVYPYIVAKVRLAERDRAVLRSLEELHIEVMEPLKTKYDDFHESDWIPRTHLAGLTNGSIIIVADQVRREIEGDFTLKVVPEPELASLKTGYVEWQCARLLSSASTDPIQDESVLSMINVMREGGIERVKELYFDG